MTNTLHGGAALVVAAVLVGGTPAVAGKPTLMPQASESVKPTASGQKEFQVSVEGACGGNNCFIEFTKKGGKERRVTNLSCLFVSEGEAIGGIVAVGGRQLTYLPISSRGRYGDAGEFAIAALAIDFVVRSGEEVQVTMVSGMPAFGASCTIHGTIE